MEQMLAISLWQRLDEWDKQLFLFLNHKLSNPLFDFILPYFRDSVFWAPLYIFIGSFILLNYGKKGLWWCIAFLCTIALTDMIGTRVFKEGIDRLRPCQDPFFYQNVRLLLKHCSSSASFVSNHAANHFGIATFISLSFAPSIGKWSILLYLWAFFVAFAQVYVGVHYPGDILGGALLGILAGVLTATILKNKLGSFTFSFKH